MQVGFPEGPLSSLGLGSLEVFFFFFNLTQSVFYVKGFGGGVETEA